MIKRHENLLDPTSKKKVNMKHNTIAPSEDELNTRHESRHLNTTI